MHEELYNWLDFWVAPRYNRYMKDRLPGRVDATVAEFPLDFGLPAMLDAPFLGSFQCLPNGSTLLTVE